MKLLHACVITLLTWAFAPTAIFAQTNPNNASVAPNNAASVASKPSTTVQTTVTSKTPPAAATSTPISAAERTRVETIVHEYLTQKPEVILEALQILQRKQFEAAQKTIEDTQKNANQFANALFKQPNDPSAGNPNAKVTIVEFFDYQCPHCIDMVPVINGVLKTNPDVRIIYKDFPVKGDISKLAALAALASNKQGKYLVFSHALLTTNKPLDENSIYQIAQTAGLNVDQLKKDMVDPAINKQLKDTMDLGQNMKLIGTPAFFVAKTDATGPKNIDYYPGQMSIEQLQAAITKANK